MMGDRQRAGAGEHTTLFTAEKQRVGARKDGNYRFIMINARAKRERRTCSATTRCDDASISTYAPQLTESDEVPERGRQETRACTISGWSGAKRMLRPCPHQSSAPR